MRKFLLFFLISFLIVSLVGCHADKPDDSVSYKTNDNFLSEETSLEDQSKDAEVSYPVIPGLYECYLTDETLGLASNEKLPLSTKRLFPEPSQIEEYAKITELTVNGVTYPCEYRESTYNKLGCRRHEYRIDCDGVTADVKVSDDMSIVSWFRTDVYRHGLLPNVVTFEEAEKLALDYASQVIDVQEYEYSTAIWEVVPEEGEPYETFAFYFRTSDPLYSRDSMSIGVSIKGYVRHVSIGSIGAYDDLPEDLIDEEKLEKTMLYYMEKIYPLYFEKELNGQYEFIERDLLLTPEGEWVLRNRYALVNGTEKKGIELTVVLLDTNASGEESLDVS